MTYLEKYEMWLASESVNEKLKAELRAIKTDDKAIRLRFSSDLEFGTAGLRGVLGAGSGCMNLVTVGWISAGLAKVVIEQGKAEQGIVVGRDSRLMSKEFAEYAASIFAAYGVKVYLFDDIRPTAEVSFAVMKFGAAAGVNITASHNPKEYNGYKVYGADGAQLAPDMAADVVLKAGTDMLLPVQSMDLKQAIAEKKITMIGEDVDREYLANISECSVENQSSCSDFKIVYTPIHGSGYRMVPRLLRERGCNFSVCEEQMMPDGHFPTADPPNPERKEAFALAVEQAKREHAQLVLGTDPDADRLGALVLHNGEYVMLTGNQIGVLLCDYILSVRQANGTLREDGFVVKSIVSTNMVKGICKAYHVELIDVLTGFKYIGQQIDKLEDKAGRKFFFGFEESYGYLGGSYARDKDAVYAAMMMTDMALHYYKQDMDLIDVLERLYQKYGYYSEKTIGLSLDPLTGKENLNKRMAMLLEQPPTVLGGLTVEKVLDFNSGIGDLPKADILAFDLQGGTRIYIRPSGTEPKVKLYVMACATTKEDVNRLISVLGEEVQKLVR